MDMTNEAIEMKYRFKMTNEQFLKLSEEQKHRCSDTTDAKKPWAVELFLEDAELEATLDGMSEAKLRERAKKTLVGELQRAGREAIEIELGLKAKSERFKAHDDKLYQASKLKLDEKLAAGVLSESIYQMLLDDVKETYGLK